MEYHSTLHPNLDFANQELDWFPMDSELTYYKNLEYKRFEMEKYGWIGSNFTYKFNSHGFRGDEFNTGAGTSIMTLGCSHAMGIGLPLENTWTYLVTKRMGLKNFNLSIGGGSNDLAFRLAHNWIRQLKPKLVIFMITHSTRLEVLDSYNSHQYNIDNDIDNNKDLLWKRWIVNEVNSNMNAIKNTMAIQHLCDSQKIKLILTTHMVGKEVDFARDLSHAGIKTNEIIADNICNIIDGDANSFGSCQYYNSINEQDISFT